VGALARPHIDEITRKQEERRTYQDGAIGNLKKKEE